MLHSGQFLQAQQEGLCLRFPDTIPPQPRDFSYEAAVNLLMRGTAMAANVPFTWSFVDKPSDGTILLIFLPGNSPFPNDGIRYQEPAEVKYTVPAGPRELEVSELSYGFIPGSSDTNASRLRRRYRLLKGGNNQFVLVHYTRGPATHIPPALMNQPTRAYPLRPVNEAAVYVTGEKVGQKVYPSGGAGPHPMHGGGGGGGGSGSQAGGSMPMAMPPATIGLGMNYSQQHAMLAQQNNTMEALERRRERDRERERLAHAAGRGNDPTQQQRPPQQQQQQQQQQRMADDDDSGDEIDQISARTLALARYKRNHDWMNEVFHHAAFGKILAKEARAPSGPYSIFSKSDIEAKAATIQAELDALHSKSAQRRADGIRESQVGAHEPPSDFPSSNAFGGGSIPV